MTGRARHGKDEVGRLLGEQGFKRYAFADGVRSMALAVNPIVDYVDSQPVRLQHLVDRVGWDEAKGRPEVRRFLQTLGTEGVREHLGSESWVRALEVKLVKDGLVKGRRLAPDARIVVTDVRFPNEADWVHDLGGQVWRVRRVHASGEPFASEVSLDHPSEVFIDGLPVEREIVAATLGELRAGVVNDA